MEEVTKLLPDEFIGRGEVNGFKFKKVKETKNVLMYQVGPDDSGPSFYYEVFRRSINSLYNTETYPSSKRFGKDAFCLMTKKDALNKFKQLQQKEKKK